MVSCGSLVVVVVVGAVAKFLNVCFVRVKSDQTPLLNSCWFLYGFVCVLVSIVCLD